MDNSLVKFLKNSATVGPMVAGPNGTFRIFPLLIPQHVRNEAKKVACIVYTVADESDGYTFCGEDGLTKVTYQLDTYAVTEEEAKALGRAVKRALSGYSGLMEGTQVSKILRVSKFNALDPDPGLYRVSQSFDVWFNDEE